MSFYLIIRGPLGCGKSTIAEELAKRLKAEYISIDNILAEHDLEKEWEEGYIAQKSFKKANEIIIPTVKKMLAKDKPVVIDGNFYWKSQVEDLITKLKFPHQVFTLKAPLEICILRDSKRKKPYGEEAARAVYKKTITFDYGTNINIDRPLQECIDEILAQLKRLH